MPLERFIMIDLIDPEFISKTWPTLSQMTYLNNASTGIPPVNTFKAMKQYLDDSAISEGKIEDTLKAFKEIRQNLAALLGGEYSQYAFVPSTSEGVNTIAHSIEYPPGSNVVICDLEFPANYIPWQNASKLYDYDLRVVKSKEGAAPLESFRDKVDENTKVIAVSQIQFGTGFRSDSGCRMRRYGPSETGCRLCDRPVSEMVARTYRSGVHLCWAVNIRGTTATVHWLVGS
jgi:selenocysteine lyase/cysteine desulfurase